MLWAVWLISTDQLHFLRYTEIRLHSTLQKGRKTARCGNGYCLPITRVHSGFRPAYCKLDNMVCVRWRYLGISSLLNLWIP